MIGQKWRVIEPWVTWEIQEEANGARIKMLGIRLRIERQPKHCMFITPSHYVANQIYFARTDPQVVMMREMFCKLPLHNEAETPEMEARENPPKTFRLAHAVNYLSDMSDDDVDIDDDGDADDEESGAPSRKAHQPPPLKR